MQPTCKHQNGLRRRPLAHLSPLTHLTCHWRTASGHPYSSRGFYSTKPHQPAGVMSGWQGHKADFITWHRSSHGRPKPLEHRPVSCRLQCPSTPQDAPATLGSGLASSLLPGSASSVFLHTNRVLDNKFKLPNHLRQWFCTSFMLGAACPGHWRTASGHPYSSRGFYSTEPHEPASVMSGWQGHKADFITWHHSSHWQPKPLEHRPGIVSPSWISLLCLPTYQQGLGQ